MPLVLRCRRCGETILVVDREYLSKGRLFPHVPFFARSIVGKCPRCGAELKEPDLDDVVVGW